MIGMAHVLVVYRVLAAALFNSALLFQEEQVTTAVVVTGALVHYVAILIMTKVAGGGGGGQREGGAGVSTEAPSEPSGLPSCRSTSVWPSSSVTLVREEASGASLALRGGVRGGGTGPFGAGSLGPWILCVSAASPSWQTGEGWRCL